MRAGSFMVHPSVLAFVLTCIGFHAAHEVAPDDAAADAAGAPARVAVLVPIRAEASWQDDVYLASISAAAHLNGGRPIALAVDGDQPWRPELLDFLKRYRPERVLWLGPDPPASAAAPKLDRLACRNAAEAACALADEVWGQADRVVLYAREDRSAALAAAALAARIDAPLFPCAPGGPAEEVITGIGRLGATRALFVGTRSAPKVAGLAIEALADAAAVARWLREAGRDIDYLAAVNPREDSAGRDRHLAAVAPLLAAGRSGVVAPLAFATEWKREFTAPQKWSARPEGAAASADGWRGGTITWGDTETRFVTGVRGRRPWLQCDLDGDGSFDGEGEAAVTTGASIHLAGRQWTVSLDAREQARGESVWLSYPSTETIQDRLADFRQAAGGPGTLCLVGWPQALPTGIVAHGQGIDADLVSDLPFGQTDDDPFVELALARFVAEDLPSATLQACRGFARDGFPDQAWRGSFATAEWAATARRAYDAAGLDFEGHHPGERPITADSPLTQSEFILHGSHAMWTQLGATYLWNSEVLLAPSLIESSGCSTASLDQDEEQRSVAARLLRQGALAFVGNTRRGIAQQRLYQTSLWNALFSGATLGASHRAALNGVTVGVLEKGQQDGGGLHYQLYNHTVYGDPGLDFRLERPRTDRPAHGDRRGRTVTVRGPRKWHRVEYQPLEEWGCAFDELYEWTAAGVVVESTWYAPEKRNAEVPYVHVRVPGVEPGTTLEPLDDAEAPLGWTGKAYFDHHADGTATLHFRVRMLDGDMTTGKVRDQERRLDFRLVGAD